tara:strand:+ start:3424 stop:3741 length:318 start_codon:yes stop_codon:yes gene_type:complete
MIVMNLGAMYNPRPLPVASEATLGGIKVGKNLEIQDGVLSATAEASKSLPTATASKKGGVKIGANLKMVGEVLHATEPEGYADLKAAVTDLQARLVALEPKSKAK